MGKRSDFERIERDFYPTPYVAVLPLLPYLSTNTKFIEPCAGDGRLIEHLQRHGHICVDAWDIEPQKDNIKTGDALSIPLISCDEIISNFPWERKILHPILDRMMSHAPTWSLHDANWMFTKQASPYLKFCTHIVTVGRVKWIEDSKMTGKDDACWFRFDINNTKDTIFFNNR